MEQYRFQMPESIRAHAAALDEALASIKLCNPAIGSGAFPVGMMQEIVKARDVLSSYLPNSRERTVYEFKRHAIQESIYGVDIDAGAIDIAKLRLWLSLVVDEEDYRTIKPLPNLDYKIVCGNSLLRVEQTLFTLALFQRLEALKSEYFEETDPTRKVEQRRAIDEIIAELTGDHSTFDMHIYFSEVFRKKGGFDVVIGNPPYVRQEKIKEYKATLKKLYPKVYAGTADLFVYFYSQGFEILSDQGVLTFITPNKFLRARYGKKLRAYFAEKVRLRNLIDFGDLPVFDATTYPMIVIGNNHEPNGNKIRVLEITSLDAISTLDQAADRAYELPQERLSAAGWQLSPPEVRGLMRKIRKTGIALDEYVDGNMYRGIVTGLNKAFIIDAATRRALLTPTPGAPNSSSHIFEGEISSGGSSINRLSTSFSRARA